MENIEEVTGNEDNEDYSFKIVVVGDAAVGKSNILYRYVNNEFVSNTKATVGVELFHKSFKINGKFVKVHIWDTAGQERYKSMTSAYYRGAKGALIVYDITREDTFKNVENWFNEIRQHGEKNIALMMVGNKCDLKDQRQVEETTAFNKAETLSNLSKR
jgi:Ras-related protein Rab-11A